MITTLIVLMLWFLAGLSLAASIGASGIIPAVAGLLTFTGAIFFIIAIVLPNPHMRRIFFEGPERDEDGEIIIGCYNFMPAAIILVAGIIWLIRIILL